MNLATIAATSHPAASQTSFFDEVIRLFENPLELHLGGDKPLAVELICAISFPLLLSESVCVKFRLATSPNYYHFSFDSRYSMSENISQLERYLESRPEPLK